MATQGDLTFTIKIDAKDVAKQIKALEKTDQSVKKADRSSKKYNKTQDEQYTRQKQGVIQTANSTKNFSKMQQQVDGGGGAGGLVRAYALLAANVFALTAAFGVLSRSAQIDTLIQSMEILSTTGGTNIEVLSREMQKASGYAVDLAQSFRQVSLASSAGLSTKEIEGLTMVAKGAAISLGRDLPDAMDRIFRGAIKLEPEILDEIGLFVRVDEAAERYGRSIGKSASALTQAEKRQGFLNEILEQGTRKFAEYADEIKPDPYVRLGAALADLAQEATSLLNMVLGPIINFLTDNPALLAAAFAGLVTFLLTKAIPALGAFNADAAAGAKAALEAETAYQEKIKGTLGLKDSKRMQSVDKDIKSADASLKTSIKEDKVRKDYWVSEAKGQKQNQADLKRNLGARKRLAATNERITFLESKKGKLSAKSNALIEKELKARKAESAELQKHVALLDTKKRLETDIASRASESSLAARRMTKLESQAASSAMVAGSVGIAETQGLTAGWKDLRAQVKEGSIEIEGAEHKLTKTGKAATLAKGGVQILGVGFQKLMMMMGPIMIAFAVLSPLLVMLGKKLGFANEESKRFGEATKNLETILENVDNRFENQTRQLLNLSRSYYETSLATQAFLKTQLELSKSVVDVNLKFLEWERTAKRFPAIFEQLTTDTLPEGASSLPGAAGIIALLQQMIDSNEDNRNKLVKATVAQKLFGAALAGDTHLLKAYTQAGVELGQDVSNALVHIGSAQKENSDIMSDEGLVNALKNNFTVQNTLNKAYANGITFTEELNKTTKDETKIKGILNGIDIRRLDTLTKNRIEIGKGQKVIEAHNISVQDGLILAEADILKTQQRIKAEKHMTDAMHGSIETVGKFQSKFMPKTSVDDILGSFTQLSDGFKDLDDKGKSFFEDFDDVTNPISRIFGPAEMKTMLDGDIALEAKKKLFNEVMNEFANAQEVLIAIANKQSKINALQKHYNSLVKAGGIAIIEEQKAISKSAELKQEQFETEFKLQSRSFTNNIDEARIIASRIRARGKDVSIQEYLNSLSERQLGYGLKEVDAKKLLGLLAKDEQVQLETKLAVGTEQERIDLAQAKYAEKKVLAEEALAKAKQKTLEESRKIGNMERGGLTGALTPQQQAVAAVQAAKASLAIAKREAEVKKATMDMEKALLDARIDILAADPTSGITFLGAVDMKENLRLTTEAAKSLIDEGTTHAEQAFTSALLSAVNTAFGGGNLTAAIFGAIQANAETDDEGTQMVSNRTASIQLLQTALISYGETLKEYGPEGEYASAFLSGISSITTGLLNLTTQFGAINELMRNEDGGFKGNFDLATESMAQMAAKAQFVANAIGAVGSMMQANASRIQASLQSQIDAERKRDGKSAQSVAKMKALEAKKTQLAKKAFEQQKKMQIAGAIANTAASIMQVMSAPGDPYKVFGIPMSYIIGALGAAQVAIIARQKFEGGSGDVGPATTSALSIGKRGNRVDVSRGASGGELGYLRGERGVGMANKFTSTGGAGGLRRGYASGGEDILVGERGPEVYRPTGGFEVIPNDALGGGASNVNFTINAVDAAGVEDVLLRQRGNIIGMLRDAANDSGERFLESVDTDVVGVG